METQLTGAEAEVTYEQTAPPVPDPATAQRKARILVVDDDPDMRRLVALVLDREGYQVMQADDGIGLLECLQSAIWSARKEPLDAIVSDIQMPDMTALEVLQAIPKRHAGTPIVLMTAFGADQVRPEAKALGAVAVLEKPIDWPKLRLAVANALAFKASTPEIRIGGGGPTKVSTLPTGPRPLS